MEINAVCIAYCIDRSCNIVIKLIGYNIGLCLCLSCAQFAMLFEAPFKELRIESTGSIFSANSQQYFFSGSFTILQAFGPKMDSATQLVNTFDDMLHVVDRAKGIH